MTTMKWLLLGGGVTALAAIVWWWGYVKVGFWACIYTLKFLLLELKAVWPAIGFSAAFIGFAEAFRYLSRHLDPKSNAFNIAESDNTWLCFFLVLAPACSVFVASAVTLEYFGKKDRDPPINRLYFICFGLAFVFNVWLSFPWKEPLWHLFFMLLLYIVFCIWDSCNWKWNLVAEEWQESKAGSLYINFPTIFAIVVLFILILFSEWKGEKNQHEFVAGIVSFHVLIASLAYFTVRFVSGSGLLIYVKSKLQSRKSDRDLHQDPKQQKTT